MRQDAEETTSRSGNAALAAMRDLQGLDLGRDSRDLKVWLPSYEDESANDQLILSDLHEDVSHNKESTASPRRWGTRRRWIPLLKT
jgi:hypothetical protein